MKSHKRALILTLATFFVTIQTGWSQGVFFASTLSARTRIGSLDGAFAGTNIYGQFFAGPTPDSLVPLGLSQPHFSNGIFGLGNTAIPSIPAYNFAYVQVFAWDAVLWGSDWTSVPADQFGKTDIVQVYLTSGVFPDGTFVPPFAQSAIVPVPEPAGWALLALAGGTLLLAARRRGRARSNSL